MYQEKLKQVQKELTQTEKIIADFFQNHSLEARSFTSYQLADRLNTAVFGNCWKICQPR